jgi:hypothetical protein
MRDPEDKRAFAEAIEMLAAVYRQEVTRPLLHGYWVVLHDLDLDVLRRQVVAALSSGSKFMPLPAELRPRQHVLAAPYHAPWIRPKEWGSSVLDEKPQWKQLTESLKPEGEES